MLLPLYLDTLSETAKSKSNNCRFSEEIEKRSQEFPPGGISADIDRMQRLVYYTFHGSPTNICFSVLLKT